MKTFCITAFLIILIVPYIGIWALNTLFPELNIPYDFTSWLAFTILWSVISYKYPQK